MKYFILAFTLISFCPLANAQVKYPVKAQFSIGLSAGLPTGNTANTHSFLVGGFLQQALPVAKALFVTGNFSYSKFIGKSNVDERLQDAPLIDYPNMDLIAAKAGLKYFLSTVVYIQGQAGIAVALNSKQSNYDAALIAFIYSPKLGAAIPLSGSNAIDISLKYEATNNFAGNYAGNISGLSIGLAYGF